MLLRGNAGASDVARSLHGLHRSGAPMQAGTGGNMSELEAQALDAFAAFRAALDGNGNAMELESPGALDDELFLWQVRCVALAVMQALCTAVAVHCSAPLCSTRSGTPSDAHTL